jgi:hypothetical protein
MKTEFKRYAIVIGLSGLLMLGACASIPLSGGPIEASSQASDPMSTGVGSGSMNTDLSRMMVQMGAGFRPKTRDQVAVIARAADAKPLGSPENPVRANSPAGQRAYIARLRCAGGDTPQIEGRMNIGIGIYGAIVDSYSLSCRGMPRTSLAMDMYHDWSENRPAAGFTMGTGPAAPST